MEAKGSEHGKDSLWESKGTLRYNLVKGESHWPLGHVIHLPREPGGSEMKKAIRPAAFVCRVKHT